MIYLIIALSAFLWRIRGGLWKEYIPANKIWYALFFAICGYFHFGNSLEKAIIGFICCYVSYQLYGWGLYFGSLPLMLSGLGMGVCYWLGGLLEKLKALGKSGWDWGEWLFGAYLGGALAVCLN